MAGKQAALDYLHKDNSHILRFSWTGEHPLTVQHIQDAFKKLQCEKLTIDQIYAVSDLIYYSHLLGKETVTTD